MPTRRLPKPKEKNPGPPARGWSRSKMASPASSCGPANWPWSTSIQKDAEGKEVTVYTTADGVVFTFDPFVALVDESRWFDPNSEEVPGAGRAVAHITLNGIECKTGLQIIYEAPKSTPLPNGLRLPASANAIFLSWPMSSPAMAPGPVVDMHRGVSQHTNGFYNVSWPGTRSTA
jgi:hypothetical protein